ncbi:transferase [Yersinia pestis biovar Orientalis str. F1991016]|nr:transferase [Yersinia pestis biovar Orientalis str. F1991016]
MGRWWRYKWITFHPSLTPMITPAKYPRHIPEITKELRY